VGIAIHNYKILTTASLLKNFSEAEAIGRFVTLLNLTVPGITKVINVTKLVTAGFTITYKLELENPYFIDGAEIKDLNTYIRAFTFDNKGNYKEYNQFKGWDYDSFMSKDNNVKT